MNIPMMNIPVVLRRNFMVSPFAQAPGAFVGLPIWRPSRLGFVEHDRTRPFIFYRRDHPLVLSPLGHGGDLVPMIPVNAIFIFDPTAGGTLTEIALPPELGEAMVRPIPISEVRFLVPVSSLWGILPAPAQLLSPIPTFLDVNYRSVVVKFVGPAATLQQLFAFFRDIIQWLDTDEFIESIDILRYHTWIRFSGSLTIDTLFNGRGEMFFQICNGISIWAYPQWYHTATRNQRIVCISFQDEEHPSEEEVHAYFGPCLDFVLFQGRYAPLQAYLYFYNSEDAANLVAMRHFYINGKRIEANRYVPPQDNPPS